jgi:hypothetical protein
MAERSYKIRKSNAGTNRQQIVYRLTVPPDIAKVIPDDTEFVPEMTEDGILYRPLSGAPQRELPAWAKRKKR